MGIVTLTPTSHGTFIQQQVGQIGAIVFQPTGYLPDQFGDVLCRTPAGFTIVQHHRQDRGQFTVGGEGLLAYQILIQQAQIAHDADSHVLVDVRLELQQQVDVEPIVSPAYPPDDVIFTTAACNCYRVELSWPLLSEHGTVYPHSSR